jgi:hypothetical protein
LQKEVYNLKELEKLGSKRGVGERFAVRHDGASLQPAPTLTVRSACCTPAIAVQQTIEEVVKSLVDDRLVDVEKIGSGNFFYSFPSKAFIDVRR